jgi:hypothetical protein
MAAGMELGAAAATILIPGVGPVLAVGIAAAAILGVGGAVGGAAAGAALEKDSTTGLPADELFVYKAALKQGRSVIFVEARDDDEGTPARRASTPPERNGGSDYAAPKGKTIALSAVALKTRSGTTGGASRQPCGTVTARPARIAQQAKPIGAATNAEQHTTSNIANRKERGFGGIRAGGLETTHGGMTAAVVLPSAAAGQTTFFLARFA